MYFEEHRFNKSKVWSVNDRHWRCRCSINQTRRLSVTLSVEWLLSPMSNWANLLWHYGFTVHKLGPNYPQTAHRHNSGCTLQLSWDLTEERRFWRLSWSPNTNKVILERNNLLFGIPVFLIKWSQQATFGQAPNDTSRSISHADQKSDSWRVVNSRRYQRQLVGTMPIGKIPTPMSIKSNSGDSMTPSVTAETGHVNHQLTGNEVSVRHIWYL